MTRPALRKLLRFGALAFVVAAIISGYPQRLFQRATPLRAVSDRPQMPNFSLPDLSGRAWNFAENKGNVLLINFWATWCPPCRRETPELVELHHKLQARGFSVVGITLDEDPPEVVPTFVKQFKVPYPVLVPDNTFTLAQQIESLPTTLLVDRAGRVAKVYHGAVHADDLEGDIETLLEDARQQ